MNKIVFLLILSLCSFSFAETTLEKSIRLAQEKNDEKVKLQKEENKKVVYNSILSQIDKVEQNLNNFIVTLTEDKVEVLEMSHLTYSDGSPFLSESSFYNLPGSYTFLKFKTIFKAQDNRICEIHSAALFVSEDNLFYKAGEFYKLGFLLHDNSPVCILNDDVVDSTDIKTMFKNEEVSF